MQLTQHPARPALPGVPAAHARGVIGLALILFLVTCVFDPADKLLGIKVWVFLLCWILTIALHPGLTLLRGLPIGLAVYVTAFLAIPLVSIAYYAITDGGQPYAGFDLLKGYILITLAPLLVLNRVTLLRELSAVLTLLAISILGVFVLLLLDPDFYAALHAFGSSTGIVFVDVRDYGSDVTLLQVYFVTSPMLVISIAYYFHQAMASSARPAKLRYFALVGVSATGMLLAGTRNNIVVSVLLPIALWLMYARRRALGAALSAIAVAFILVLFSGELQTFFDPTEHSNSLKLALVNDYARIFEDPIALLFGQGLGAYHYWDATGKSFYVTELTYLELVRSFGLVGGAVMFGLLVFPIAYAFASNKSLKLRAVVIGYAFYLLMCASNPNLFSSMGILFLSVILAMIYLARGAGQRPRNVLQP